MGIYRFAIFSTHFLISNFLSVFFLFHFEYKLSHREHYFASAAWVSQTEVSVVWMNRAQNLSVVTLCKSPMWYCQEVSK